MPKVAMKAGIRSLVTTRPLSKPNRTPNDKAATTVKTTPREGSSSEIRTPQSPSKPATDKSNAPETIKSVIPAAPIPANEAWRRIFSKFAMVLKYGFTAPRITTETTSRD